MQLSEAMRKGSKLMRQKFGDFGDGFGGGCAMTMAMVGGGGNGTFQETLDLITKYPVLKEGGDCPLGCYRPSGNGYMANWHLVIHLNDWHRWSPERIAGYIESHLETPTYSMLEIQEFIGEPILDPVGVLR